MRLFGYLLSPKVAVADVQGKRSGSLELLGNASLLQDAIGRVARLDLAIDREATFGNRAIPNLVIPIALPMKIATVLL
jgi:hypothetical protein